MQHDRDVQRQIRDERRRAARPATGPTSDATRRASASRSTGSPRAQRVRAPRVEGGGRAAAEHEQLGHARTARRHCARFVRDCPAERARAPAVQVDRRERWRPPIRAPAETVPRAGARARCERRCRRDPRRYSARRSMTATVAAKPSRCIRFSIGDSGTRSTLMRRSASGAIARSSASADPTRCQGPCRVSIDRDAPHRLDARVAARQAVPEVVAARRIAGDENRAVRIAEVAARRPATAARRRAARPRSAAAARRRAGVGQIGRPLDRPQRLRRFPERRERVADRRRCARRRRVRRRPRRAAAAASRTASSVAGVVGAAAGERRERRAPVANAGPSCRSRARRRRCSSAPPGSTW